MNRLIYSLSLIFSLTFLAWANPFVTGARGEMVAAGWKGEASSGSGRALSMPSQCRTGKTSPEALGWRWRPDALVRVYYLKGDFDAVQAQALSRAVNNWNAALREIGSRIVFIVGGERESIAREDASITVMRGVPAKKERLGELKFYATTRGALRTVLTVRSVVKDASALTSLMTHELGHTLGLADCYECKRGTTAMSAFKDDNKGNDVYEPSVCDKYVVAAGYAAQTTAQEASRLQASRE